MARLLFCFTSTEIGHGSVAGSIAIGYAGAPYRSSDNDKPSASEYYPGYLHIPPAKIQIDELPIDKVAKYDDYVLTMCRISRDTFPSIYNAYSVKHYAIGRLTYSVRLWRF